MTSLTVRIFPLCALLISVFGCIWPEPLAALGGWIVPMLGIIMLGMGTTLSPADFIAAAKHPKAVLTGILLQFLLMPLLAWLTAHLLHLPKEQFIGVIMVGTVAGGTASNVIAYLAGGDVALSITMTACSTIGSHRKSSSRNFHGNKINRRKYRVICRYRREPKTAAGSIGEGSKWYLVVPERPSPSGS